VASQTGAATAVASQVAAAAGIAGLAGAVISLSFSAVQKRSLRAISRDDLNKAGQQSFKSATGAAVGALVQGLGHSAGIFGAMIVADVVMDVTKYAFGSGRTKMDKLILKSKLRVRACQAAGTLAVGGAALIVSAAGVATGLAPVFFGLAILAYGVSTYFGNRWSKHKLDTEMTQEMWVRHRRPSAAVHASILGLGPAGIPSAELPLKDEDVKRMRTAAEKRLTQLRAFHHSVSIDENDNLKIIENACDGYIECLTGASEPESRLLLGQ